MKKIFLAIAFIGGFMLSHAQTKAPNEKQAVNGPKMEFKTSVMDYGLIEHNSDGNREFVLTNTGNAPLIISNAKGSCGCTVPTWPKAPIAPGESASIGVKYSTNRIGKFTKTITLTTNTEEKTKILTIKGEVKKPIEAPAAPTKPKSSVLEVK
ncbi:MAG: hypothetical protein CMP64_05080 [Flavobacteriales bacterium]|nr:hypothetical protein [Flavobacteriales bacterium]|tara:strand:- start:3628 stop:4086 length:459 start_codon:yes stop_codon:yes gene_type:complete